MLPPIGGLNTKCVCQCKIITPTTSAPQLCFASFLGIFLFTIYSLIETLLYIAAGGFLPDWQLTCMITLSLPFGLFTSGPHWAGHWGVGLKVLNSMWDAFMTLL